MKYNYPLTFFALAIQAVATLVVTVIIWNWRGWQGGAAALYGGAVSLASSGLLAWRWWRGLADSRSDGPHHLKIFYRSMLERFFVVVGFLAAGLGLLKLPPPSLLTGYIVGLLVWTITAAALKTK